MIGALWNPAHSCTRPLEWGLPIEHSGNHSWNLILSVTQKNRLKHVRTYGLNPRMYYQISRHFNQHRRNHTTPGGSSPACMPHHLGFQTILSFPTRGLRTSVTQTLQTTGRPLEKVMSQPPPPDSARTTLDRREITPRRIKNRFIHRKGTKNQPAARIGILKTSCIPVVVSRACSP